MANPVEELRGELEMVKSELEATRLDLESTKELVDSTLQKKSAGGNTGSGWLNKCTDLVAMLYNWQNEDFTRDSLKRKIFAACDKHATHDVAGPIIEKKLWK